MPSQSPQLDTLLRLESQHEDLLSRLGELDKRVKDVLTDWQADQRRQEAAESAEPMAVADDQL